MSVQSKQLGDRSWRLRTDRFGDEAAIKEVYIEDCYKLRSFVDGLPISSRKPWFLDVGAHIGAFSTLVFQLVPGANVVSVEPNHESAALLRANLADCGERSIVIEKALRHDGSNLLTSFTQSTLGNKIVRRGQEGGDYPGLYEVETTTLSQIISDLGVDWFDFVKLDCELSEHDILPVIAMMPERFRRIIGEWHAMPSEVFSRRLAKMFGKAHSIVVDPAPTNDTMGMFSIGLRQ